MVAKGSCIVCSRNSAVRTRDRVHVDCVTTTRGSPRGAHDPGRSPILSNALGRANETHDCRFTAQSVAEAGALGPFPGRD
jgi:hypothetical protein